MRKKTYLRGGITFCFCLILISFSGCKKFVAVDLPIDKITAPAVYGNTATASAALSGIYFGIGNGGLTGGTDVFGMANVFALSADELKPGVNVGDAATIYSNSYVTDPSNIWNNFYSNYIFKVNSAIEGVTASKGIPDGSKQVLLGEARFLRAFFYFYLVNVYGDVPLVTGTDFTINSRVSRSPKAAVYDQIISDLLASQQGLTDNYLQPDLLTTTTERVRPNKAAATALLARVYLYTGQWQKAEAEATKVITNGNYELLADLNAVFLKNSRETIWQAQPNPAGYDGDTGAPKINAPDGIYFIPVNGGDIPNAGLSEFLLNSFVPGDQRKDAWSVQVFGGVESYIIPYKYKAGLGYPDQVEYQMVLRLAEQYLIRAEARARNGNIAGAQADINAIRTRAGLANTTAGDQIALLVAIAQERRVELFTEWGDRWFDLKRTVKIDDVMKVVTPLKGGSWVSFKALFPIPKMEFKLNPNLTQNPGYPTN